MSDNAVAAASIVAFAIIMLALAVGQVLESTPENICAKQKEPTPFCIEMAKRVKS